GVVLSEIIFSEKYAECGIQEIVSFEGWEVRSALGIPRCINSFWWGEDDAEKPCGTNIA
ncbi:hypothetical protein HN873_068172, partial [Arachis hypogaea]